MTGISVSACEPQKPQFTDADKVKIREVSIEVQGGELRGTLAKATGVKALSNHVVLFVSGSGANDRDGNTVGAFGKNNCLKYLSNKIVNAGITTLRVDKRGVAASKHAIGKEVDLRFDTYVHDITRWIHFLTSQGYTHIILLGHSEGALIATMAAKHPSVKSLISISGAGKPITEILKLQLKPNLPPELYQKTEQIMAQLNAGKLVPKIPASLNSLFRPSVQPYLISWFKINPTTEISKLKKPVLIMQGTTDLQVTPDDANRLNKAARNSKLVIIKGMNHVLKQVGGNLQEQLPSYFDPKLPIHPQLAKEITNFLEKKQQPQ